MTLSARRAAADGLEAEKGYSERRACELVGLSRSSCRYRPREEAGEEKVLRGRIRELAHEHPRYGCPRITVMLHREGRQVNKKRVHRLWKEEGPANPPETEAEKKGAYQRDGQQGGP